MWMRSRGRSLRSPCHTPKADGYSLRHDKRPHLLGGGAPKIRVSTVLLKMLAALCMLNSAGAMTTPPPPSTPPYGRVECGKPGLCSEAAGLRNPNELHEVRACNASSLTFRALSMLTATPIRGRRCGAAPTSSPQAGPALGLAALCGGSRMRGGSARATRPSPRPRPSAKPQVPGSAPLPSSWAAAPEELGVASTLSWCGASLRHPCRQCRSNAGGPAAAPRLQGSAGIRTSCTRCAV